MEFVRFLADNPSLFANLFGICVFLVCFIPILRWIIKWAEKTTQENREAYSTALLKAEAREERLQTFIETKISDHTDAIEKMHETMERINGNISDLSDRVEEIEGKIDVKNRFFTTAYRESG